MFTNMPVLLQYLLGLIALLGVVAYGYGQWKQGRNKSKMDTVGILESDVGILKGKVEELTNVVERLTKEISEKDKRLTAALEILQGRDPAMSEFVKTVQAYIVLTSPVLDRLNTFLNKQTF